MGDLAKDTEDLKPEDFKSNAEFYKFRLDVRKDAREDSLTRKGSVWMQVLLVPIVTAALAFYGTLLQRSETDRQQNLQRAETERQNKRQEEETKRKAEEEVTKRHIDNARLALDMYVKNPDLFDKTKNANAVFHVRMVAVISDNDALKAIFNEMMEQVIREKRATTSSVSEAAVNVPDRIVAKPPEGAYPAYLVYVQALAADAQRGQRVVAALCDLKFRVPGLDTRVNAVPSENELRYYRAEQRDYATRLAADLQSRVGESFSVKQLNMPQLPDGIIEVWIKHPG